MGKKLLLAVSGGIDSMYMASTALRDGLPFAVAHCNFKLRGADSDADEALVRGWCVRAGVECFVKAFDTAGYAAAKGVSIEMAARELRYGWFAELCQAMGFEAVMVAHNANDNAETLILNLLRGTGIKGLCGMAERATRMVGGLPLTIVRPLLQVPRSRIEEYVRANAVPYREDRSNADLSFKRNRIRHEVLPALEAVNPSALQTLSADMARFREVSAIADDYFESFLVEAGMDSLGLPLKVSTEVLLRKKHWKYLLFRMMEPFGFNGADAASAARLLESGSGTISGKRFCGEGVVAYFTSSDFVITGEVGKSLSASWEPVVVAGPGKWACGSGTVEVTVGPSPENPALEGGVILDAAKISFPLLLRPWREGDWMCPLGMGGRRRKLSDVFVSLKISAPEKEGIVLLAYPGQEGRIAAVTSYGKIDDSLKVSADTQRVIKII